MDGRLPVRTHGNGGTKKGIDYILPMVESQSPFDLLIIMLGSNDLKKEISSAGGRYCGKSSEHADACPGISPVSVS